MFLHHFLFTEKFTQIYDKIYPPEPAEVVPAPKGLGARRNLRARTATLGFPLPPLALGGCPRGGRGALERRPSFARESRLSFTGAKHIKNSMVWGV